MSRNAQSLDELLQMRPEQLAKVDIAVINLLAATGLPGAEDLDIDRCLARLDEWAVRVRLETSRHLYRAHDPRWADHYKHCENWLRAEMLAQVLQEDCGVHYNMQRIRNIDFTNSRDLFIHGMIDDENGGTCISMPVLYVAVGRRLGYPLRLVLAKAHVFARWDDGRERFNVETAGNGGVDSYPDEHYKTWPLELTPVEVASGRFLRSLSPVDVLACFLAGRGHCLLDNGRASQARDAYAAAHRLVPNEPTYLAWARQAESRTRQAEFPDPPMVYPSGALDHLRRIEAINAHNRQMVQEGIRPPKPPTPQVPRPPLPHGPKPGGPHPYRPPGPGRPRG